MDFTGRLQSIPCIELCISLLHHRIALTAEKMLVSVCHASSSLCIKAYLYQAPMPCSVLLQALSQVASEAQRLAAKVHPGCAQNHALNSLGALRSQLRTRKEMSSLDSRVLPQNLGVSTLKSAGASGLLHSAVPPAA